MLIRGGREKSSGEVSADGLGGKKKFRLRGFFRHPKEEEWARWEVALESLASILIDPRWETVNLGSPHSPSSQGAIVQ